jgi:imidazole glycerol phosphate synthase glutamine amidotransferase subunit
MADRSASDAVTGGVEVVVARTGVANVASMLAGLTRAGARARLSADADEVTRAARVVLPGVGSFGAAMRSLRDNGLDEAIRDRIAAGRATLAVCLGLHLLGHGSEESPDVDGLGVIDFHAARFDGPTLRVPQLGWNTVDPDPDCAMLRRGHAYFANSYRVVGPPAGWRCATTDYGGPFVSAIERGPVLACQFHPELSGRWGLDLLARWIGHGADDGGASC